MFRNLFKVSLRQTLPRLRHHLTSGRKLDTPDEDAQLLLDAGIARDWTNARMLIKRSGKTPVQLFWELSKKFKPDWRGRLRNRLIDMSGSYRFDPHQRELKEVAKSRDRPR